MKIYSLLNLIIYSIVISVLTKKRAEKLDSLDNMLFRLVMLVFIGWICLTGAYESLSDFYSTVSSSLNSLLWQLLTTLKET